MPDKWSKKVEAMTPAVYGYTLARVFVVLAFVTGVLSLFVGDVVAERLTYFFVGVVFSSSFLSYAASKRERDAPPDV